MSDELREAAERFRDSVYEESDEGHDQFRDDVRKLADAYLAEHPPDDDTPIDDVVACSYSAQQATSDGMVWVLGMADVGRTVTLFRRHTGPTLYAVYLGGTKVNMVGSVGQLRRLCEALGIELKEGK